MDECVATNRRCFVYSRCIGFLWLIGLCFNCFGCVFKPSNNKRLTIFASQCFGMLHRIQQFDCSWPKKKKSSWISIWLIQLWLLIGWFKFFQFELFKLVLNWFDWLITLVYPVELFKSFEMIILKFGKWIGPLFTLDLDELSWSGYDISNDYRLVSKLFFGFNIVTKLDWMIETTSSNKN